MVCLSRFVIVWSDRSLQTQGLCVLGSRALCVGLGPRFATLLGPCAQRAVFSLHPKPAEDPSRQLVWCRVAGLLMYDGGFPFQMEHLKACAEIAAQRTVNWQKFCIKDDCKQCSPFWLLVIHSFKNY